YFRALTGKSKKCLVLDLDNTLWGGVLGEDGVGGIKLGSTYPGSAYLAFQREILHLHQRGVLLAISSKNNLEDVQEVFSTRSEMLLQAEHFAALEVHWKPKTQSLLRIADRLGIALEHMVFVDDDLAECESVSSSLPQV